LRLGQWRSYIYVAVMICALAVTAFPQADQGRIGGVVKDSTGAVIPGVSVVVKNERTGEEHSVISGDTGDYLVVGLRPSTYSVKATLSSFAPAEVTGILLFVGQ
jgi:hypothetical protein